jgi:predicted enzyme related to lactoylglutathione lyase
MPDERHAAHEIAIQRAVAEQGYRTPTVRLADATATALGRPYILMDRADGQPLLVNLRIGRALTTLPRILGSLPGILAGTLVDLRRLDPKPVRDALEAAGASDQREPPVRNVGRGHHPSPPPDDRHRRRTPAELHTELNSNTLLRHAELEVVVAEPNIDIVIDCADPETLAEFWAEALGYTKAGMFDPYFVLVAPTREHPPVILQKVPEPKTVKARIHFDLRIDDIETEAKRLEQLGARRIDIGQGPNPGWITMADPEGNEFCVCPGIPLPPVA